MLRGVRSPIWRWGPAIASRLTGAAAQVALRIRGNCTIGRGVRFIGMPIVVCSPGSSVRIGRAAVLCSDRTRTALGVSHPVILRTLGPGALIDIGEGVRMSGTSICAAELVSIGDRCVIGADVWIVDTDFHALDPHVRSSSHDSRLASVAAVRIGSDVFIGGRVVVLKGVTIGDGAVVGAASVVTDDVLPNAVVAGNPARTLGRIGVGG